MVQKICNHSAMLVLGLFAGLGVAGFWQSSFMQGNFQRIAVDATATQGQGNSAIATGLIDNGIEGFFFLDVITGDLRCAVVNRRNREFSAFFEHNVQRDFGAAVKNPKFLMVTGLADLPRGRSNTQFSKCMIYVCEATSGLVNAYVLPWNSSLHAAGKPQGGTFLRVAGGEFRTTFVRDQE